MEEKVASSQLKLFADSEPITADEEYGNRRSDIQRNFVIICREKTERRKMKFETEDDDEQDEEEEEEDDDDDQESEQEEFGEEYIDLIFISIDDMCF
jgi:hypothetical protein